MWILSITPLSSGPADAGEDAAGLRNAVFDVRVTQPYSPDTLAAVGTLLETAGVGVVGTSILFTSGVRVPRTPTVVLTDAGGSRPMMTQMDPLALQSPVVRVVASAVTQKAAHDLAWLAYLALDGVTNQEVG